jgi:hypothetical protein
MLQKQLLNKKTGIRPDKAEICSRMLQEPKKEGATSVTPSFSIVGIDGFEPPTLCL